MTTVINDGRLPRVACLFAVLLAAFATWACSDVAWTRTWSAPHASVTMEVHYDVGPNPVGWITHSIDAKTDGEKHRLFVIRQHDEIDAASVFWRHVEPSTWYLAVGAHLALSRDDGRTWCTWDARTECEHGWIDELHDSPTDLEVVLGCDARRPEWKLLCRSPLTCELDCVETAKLGA